MFDSKTDKPDTCYKSRISFSKIHKQRQTENEKISRVKLNVSLYRDFKIEIEIPRASLISISESTIRETFAHVILVEIHPTEIQKMTELKTYFHLNCNKICNIVDFEACHKNCQEAIMRYLNNRFGEFISRQMIERAP